MVYGYRNKINDKWYMGECYEDRELIRKEQHITFYNRYIKGIAGSYCRKFYNAINKYGIDVFEYKVLERDIDVNKIYEREVYWGNFYDSINNGYNLSLGKGNSKVISDETKKRMRIAHSGENHHLFGKKT